MQNIDLCLMKFGRHQKLRFEIESKKKKKRNFFEIMKKNKNNIQTWASLSIMQQNTLGLRALHWIQTIEVEEVVPVEWVLMELVNGHQMLSINVLPQGLLATAAALISNQGLQHGSHHIQLVRKITEVWFYTSLQKPFTENASTLPMKISEVISKQIYFYHWTLKE